MKFGDLSLLLQFACELPNRGELARATVSLNCGCLIRQRGCNPACCDSVGSNEIELEERFAAKDGEKKPTYQCQRQRTQQPSCV